MYEIGIVGGVRRHHLEERKVDSEKKVDSVRVLYTD